MGLGTLGVGLAAGSSLLGLGRSLFGTPDFPISEGDVNRQFDRALAQAMSQIALGTRRRLIGSGQEGSGTINAAILDAQQRARTGLEDQRQQALQQLRIARANQDMQAFNSVQNILGSLGGIGTSLAFLGQSQGNTGTTEFQNYLDSPVGALSPRPTLPPSPAAAGNIGYQLRAEVPQLNLGF